MTLPLPTAARDRATLEQEALPLVLRGDEQTAALQPLGEEEGGGACGGEAVRGVN